MIQGIYLPLNGKSNCIVGEKEPSLWIMLTGPNNNPALMFLNEEFKNTYGFVVLAALNGYYPNGLFADVEVRNKTDIWVNNEPVMRIRGWGYLTGLGAHALGLDSNDAAKIQDEFAEYIVKSLKIEVHGTE